jgi:hypothetical protein
MLKQGQSKVRWNLDQEISKCSWGWEYSQKTLVEFSTPWLESLGIRKGNENVGKEVFRSQFQVLKTDYPWVNSGRRGFHLFWRRKNKRREKQRPTMT